MWRPTTHTPEEVAALSRSAASEAGCKRRLPRPLPRQPREPRSRRSREVARRAARHDRGGRSDRRGGRRLPRRLAPRRRLRRQQLDQRRSRAPRRCSSYDGRSLAAASRTPPAPAARSAARSTSSRRSSTRSTTTRGSASASTPATGRRPVSTSPTQRVLDAAAGRSRRADRARPPPPPPRQRLEDASSARTATGTRSVAQGLMGERARAPSSAIRPSGALPAILETRARTARPAARDDLSGCASSAVAVDRGDEADGLTPPDQSPRRRAVRLLLALATGRSDGARQLRRPPRRARCS